MAPRRAAHPQRKEIARYLLSRGLEPSTAEPDVDDREVDLGSGHHVVFPDGLTPTPAPLDPAPTPDAPLPAADVVVITWTVDELAALAHVLTPGHSASRWYHYAHRFDEYRDRTRPHSPAARSGRLGSYLPSRVGPVNVLCMKSELHLNQDGVRTGEGTATLPVKDFFTQIIAETGAAVVLTIGTAGSVYERFGLGDVVITRAAKFRLQNEFRNEAFNGQIYRSNWTIPTHRLPEAEHLMRTVSSQIEEPPFGPPTRRYPHADGLGRPLGNRPQVRLEQGGRDMPEFHPILTTDYFEYGTSSNRLDKEGAAVEMGDAVLGLSCHELDRPPHWAVVRNMSDPVINGNLPSTQYRLNEQTTWAVGYYTAYGRWTSTMGALTTWGILAGLADTGSP